jgi:uncharacterized Zn-binding protein involved in type VI secretion
MAAAQRQGDANSAGGVCTTGVSSVRVNGRPIVVPGMSVSPHPCCGLRGCAKHCLAKTVGGSRTVRAGGKAVVRTGDADTCGHARIGGSTNVGVA